MLPEDIDLARLVEKLHTKLGHDTPVGYLRGKSVMRDLLVHEEGYSELAAEELIDTLELRGYLHFLGDPSERSRADAHWELQRPE